MSTDEINAACRRRRRPSEPELSTREPVTDLLPPEEAPSGPSEASPVPPAFAPIAEAGHSGPAQPSKSSRRRTARRAAGPSPAKAASAIWNELTLTHVPIGLLKPYKGNPRKHPETQIGATMVSMSDFGVNTPIGALGDGTIISGHARYEAALRLGLEEVPVVWLDHLSPAQQRAYRIADNRIAERATWDFDLLRAEFELILEEAGDDLTLDLTSTGFEMGEIDVILDGPGEAGGKMQPEESVELPAPDARAVSRLGDLWQLGPHRIVCGNALEPATYVLLMDGELARQVLTDPPYNVRIVGHVRTGTGGGQREFAMGVGEMSRGEFVDFLAVSLGLARDATVEGGILAVFMDWRHEWELLTAIQSLGLSHLNTCIWAKTTGGMGSLYRSQHEFAGIFKKGQAPHINNVQLGKYGRYRTNLWTYPGVNAFRAGRKADLADHPTIKNAAMIADAIKDVTNLGDLVLDPFGGSGTTLLAAEKTGRRARLIELDPLYVDVTIRRWEALTGEAAVHAGTSETFAERAAALDAQGRGAAS